MLGSGLQILSCSEIYFLNWVPGGCLCLHLACQNSLSETNLHNNVPAPVHSLALQTAAMSHRLIHAQQHLHLELNRQVFIW